MIDLTGMQADIKLAVIIPAYKATYFYDALDSLVRQTDKRFNVYIGDDNSPNDLKSISDQFEGKLNIFYTKFPDNVGAKDIVSQWERCVNLTKNEDWLWLFSDDDITHEACVEKFYGCLDRNGDKFDVYRFNTEVINNLGEVTDITPVGPEIESSHEMAYNLLLGKRGNSMPDHIFSRAVYVKSGGFVNTPFAQGADWAMSMLFSKDKGLCIIEDAKLYWRFSGINITAKAASIKSQTIVGHLAFIHWVLIHFDYLKTGTYSISYEQMEGAALANLKNIIIWHYQGIPNKMMFSFAKYLNTNFKMNYVKGMGTFFSINKKFIRRDIVTPFKKIKVIYTVFSFFKYRVFKVKPL